MWASVLRTSTELSAFSIRLSGRHPRMKAEGHRFQGHTIRGMDTDTALQASKYGTSYTRTGQTHSVRAIVGFNTPPPRHDGRGTVEGLAVEVTSHAYVSCFL